MRLGVAVVALVLLVGGSAAAAKKKHHHHHKKKPAAKKADPSAARKVDPAAVKECLRALDKLKVPYKKASPQVGIEIPVRVTGPLGGVTYKGFSKHDLILDCSLVYSLAQAGEYFTDEGLLEGTYSSAYQRRNIHGTNKPSNHSYGLALDVHQWKDKSGDELAVKDWFEKGLGDQTDCIGEPGTQEARILRTVWCRMDRSGMFRFILNPDSDAEHWNHYHIEVLPWEQRTDVKPSAQVQERAE